MAEKPKTKVKATMADLEAKGVDIEALAVGKTLVIEQIYPRVYSTGSVGIGGKIRAEDGTLIQVSVGVVVQR